MRSRAASSTCRSRSTTRSRGGGPALPRHHPHGRAERRGRHEHRLRRPLQRLRATGRRSTRRCSRPSSGSAFIGFFPGLPFMFPLDPRETRVRAEVQPVAHVDGRGRGRARRPVLRDLSGRVGGRLPAARADAADLRPRRPERDLPRRTAAAARRATACRFHRVEEDELLELFEDVHADRYRYRIEEDPFDVRRLSRLAADGRSEAEERRARGGRGGRGARRCREAARDPRGRHPDHRPGLPGPARDARAGLLPGRADGPLRPPRRQPARREPGPSAAGLEVTLGNFALRLRHGRARSRSAAPRRRSRWTASEIAALGEPRLPAGAEMRIGIAPGPRAFGSTSPSPAASTYRRSSAPVRPTRWALSAASRAGRSGRATDCLSETVADGGGAGRRFSEPPALLARVGDRARCAALRRRRTS